MERGDLRAVAGDIETVWALHILYRETLYEASWVAYNLHSGMNSRAHVHEKQFNNAAQYLEFVLGLTT